MIPIWQGNRTLDLEHAKKIKEAIGSDIKKLDHGFHIIKYDELSTDNTYVEQVYIIDGQHRIWVIKDYIREHDVSLDFNILVIEKKVSCELEAIQYFNGLNMVKPQCWTEDRNLIINRFIVALEKRFNKLRKPQLIRSGRTSKPYLASDRVREELKKPARLNYSKEYIDEFVEKVYKKNESLKLHYQLKMILDDDTSRCVKTADKLGFYLALDGDLKWIGELLG